MKNHISESLKRRKGDRVMDLLFRIVECGGSGFRVTPWYNALQESKYEFVLSLGYGNRGMGRDLYFTTMLEF